MTPIKIGGITIPKWNHDLSPYENYKASLIAELIVSNKQKQQLKESFENAKVEYGEKKINNTVVLNDVDFELWIKANINDDSMVCLGDKIIREIKRMYDQLEDNIKLVFSDPAEAYDKLEDGVKDAGSWIDDNITQKVGEYIIEKPLDGLKDGLDKVFGGGGTIVSTYLSNELGYGKENEILATLLDWRDRYIITDEKRNIQLHLYYKSAKCIIKNQLKNNKIAQRYYFENMVLKTYEYIKAGDDHKAWVNYRNYLLELADIVK